MTIEAIDLPRAKRGRGSRRGINWEQAGWVFMRGSGVLLIVLIFGHLFMNLWAGEGVSAIDFAFVAGKWANPFWQWWDALMLVLALIHGANGMRTIVNDYVYRPGPRKAILVALAVAAAVEIVLGLLVIFTFDPCPANSPVELLPSFCPAAV